MKAFLKLILVISYLIIYANPQEYVPTLDEMKEACGIINPGGDDVGKCTSLDATYQRDGYSCCHVYFKLDIMDYYMCKLIKKDKDDLKDFKDWMKDNYHTSDLDIDCGSSFLKKSLVLFLALAFLL